MHLPFSAEIQFSLRLLPLVINGRLSHKLSSTFLKCPRIPQLVWFSRAWGTNSAVGKEFPARTHVEQIVKQARIFERTVEQPVFVSFVGAWQGECGAASLLHCVFAFGDGCVFPFVLVDFERVCMSPLSRVIPGPPTCRVRTMGPHAQRANAFAKMSKTPEGRSATFRVQSSRFFPLHLLASIAERFLGTFSRQAALRVANKMLPDMWLRDMVKEKIRTNRDKLPPQQQVSGCSVLEVGYTLHATLSATHGVPQFLHDFLERFSFIYFFEPSREGERKVPLGGLFFLFFLCFFSLFFYLIF